MTAQLFCLVNIMPQIKNVSKIQQLAFSEIVVYNITRYIIISDIIDIHPPFTLSWTWFEMFFICHRDTKFAFAM